LETQAFCLIVWFPNELDITLDYVAVRPEFRATEAVEMCCKKVDMHRHVYLGCLWNAGPIATERQVTRATEFCNVASNIFGFSVCGSGFMLQF